MGGLDKKVKMLDDKSIEEKLPILQAMDVSQASASVASDKELVLSKIADIDHFNHQLRDVVLNSEHGLMSKYVRSSGLGMQALATIALSASTESLDLQSLIDEALSFFQG